MAGSQIVLHERDNGAQIRKNETRNLGLQSIVNKENSEVENIIGEANKQQTVAKNVIETANKLTRIAANLQWISESIFQVCQIIYTRRDKWVGGQTIISQSRDIITAEGL